MSQSSRAYIYTGHWINWSRGAILGSTLTLSTRDGGLLTAFIAIFVALAGAAFWKILSYLLHQYRASEEYQHAIHQQEQLVLRNTTSPADAAWQFAQIGFYWRNIVSKSILRSLPLVFLALFNVGLFGLASIFSSYVTRAPGDETLITSPNCGLWLLNDTYDSSDTTIAMRTKTLSDTVTASDYARACYNNTENILQCNQYTAGKISWKVNQNASCPFAPELCSLGPNSAYEMDTGPIDSHTVLGINAPTEARITMRKVTTCSPIHVLDDFYQVYNDTDKTHLAYGNTFVRYNFGEISTVSNYTYAYNMVNSYSDPNYDLIAFLSQGGADENAWVPVAELNRQDASVSLFLLAANSITYDAPVSDPFYSANLEKNVSLGNEIIKYWMADYYVTVLACIDQYQFCSPSSHECTPLTSSWLSSRKIPELNLKSSQNMTAIRLGVIAQTLNMANSVEGRGLNALRASETLWQRTQVALPNDQWMIEVNSWMASSMARLQQLVVQYATGPPNIPAASYIMNSNTEREKTACHGQKVRNSSGTISFSMLGVAIILIVGWILIITSLSLSTVAEYLRRTVLKKGAHKPLHWILDEKFQTQRLAYEEAGQGIWTGGASAVPVTAKGDKIGLPAGTDRQHPRLNGTHGLIAVTSHEVVEETGKTDGSTQQPKHVF